MKTALDHPLVADYLRALDGALASLEPGAAAELSEQLTAHILEAVPPDASDEMVAEVLAALGPPTMVAAEAGPPWPQLNRPRQSLRRRIAIRAKRTPLRAWLVIVPLVLAVCLAVGAFIFWEDQPTFYSGESMWWYSIDRAHDVNTEAAGATQATAPLRPGQLQGIVVELENPSDVTQRILGTPGISGTPYFMGFMGTPVPPQIAVATTSGPDDDPYTDHYAIGGSIPPHSYRWVRVIWRSWHCLFNVPGGSTGSNQLTLRVRVGWITRTEVIQLPSEFALSETKANLDPAYCKAHGGQPGP